MEIQRRLSGLVEWSLEGPITLAAELQAGCQFEVMALEDSKSQAVAVEAVHTSRSVARSMPWSLEQKSDLASWSYRVSSIHHILACSLSLQFLRRALGHVESAVDPSKAAGMGLERAVA